MTLPVVLLFGLNLIGAGLLLHGLLRNLRLVKALRAEYPAATPLPPSAAGGSRIEVEILNPFALARRETAFAGPAAVVAPELIRRIVYDRAAQDISKELVDRGVEARVRVRRG